MAKNFLDHLAKVADKEIKRSIREAEKRRKREARESIRQQKAFDRELLRKQKKLDRELAKQQKAKERFENKVKTTLLNAKTLKKENDIKKAIKGFEKVLSLDKSNQVAYNKLMNIYKDIKDYENEENIIVQALNYYPNNEEYKNRLIEVATTLTNQN